MTFNPKTAVQHYLYRLAMIRGTGAATAETSFYSALEALLNAVGGTLDPHVVCNGQLRQQGAGHPDFGLYTLDQCDGETPKHGQGAIPARGVVEVKGLAEETWLTARTAQVTDYFERYGLVLVTNYRAFRLVGRDAAGKPVKFDSFVIAATPGAFWDMAAHPQRSANQIAERLVEFLARALLSKAPIARADDVAWFLASHARDALKILEAKEAAALKPLRDALETALGIRFDGEKGEYFFRSTLVQTLFYGIFSAWVVWAKGKPTGMFDWRQAGYILTVPMVSALFEGIARPTRLGQLGLLPVLDRAGGMLNRITAADFIASFDAGEAVQHFYEPFLQAYDPALRKELGVWYTPPEIVRYMVERVDRVLRTELGLPDGLADKRVHVLDPCCGTGAFLAEVLKRIERTLREKNDDALVAGDVKEAAQKRVFGFEIMSAPFVVAHWRVGNLLAGIDAPLDGDKHERAAIYLTNALTGWEPPEKPKEALLSFPEFGEERDAADHVKQDAPFLVVIGNPPYNAYAGISPGNEAGLVEPYKEGLEKIWGVKKYNLDDLYVRFFRIAERRIAKTGRGVVSYISNYSYLRGRSFVVMRQKLLESFDKFWIENLHGDRKISEYAPDGRTSQTVFAIQGFSAGIQQGVATVLAVKSGKQTEQKAVRFRNDLDAAKADDRRKQLLASIDDPMIDSRYEIATPNPSNFFSFWPRDIGDDYLGWPKLTELT